MRPDTKNANEWGKWIVAGDVAVGQFQFFTSGTLSLSEKTAKAGGEPARTFRLALPNNKEAPASRLQPAKVLRVTFDVPRDFRPPKGPVRLRPLRAVLTAMTVPEASVNENHLAATGEYDIRLAGQTGTLKPKAVAHPVRHPPHDLFRLCIVAPNGTHVGAAPLG